MATPLTPKPSLAKDLRKQPTGDPSADKWQNHVTTKVNAFMKGANAAIQAVQNTIAGGVVNAVTGTAPITSTGGTTPAIGLAASGVTAATYGDATHVGQFDVSADGIVTGARNIPITGVTSKSTRLYAGIRSNSPSGPWVDSATNLVRTIGVPALGSGGNTLTDGTSLDPSRVLTIFPTGSTSGNSTHVGMSVGNSANSTVPTYGYAPILQGCVQAITLTNVREWMGLVEGNTNGVTMLGLDNSSTISYVMLRFSTSAGDTTWVLCTGDGSGHHETASAVTVAAGSTVVWALDCSIAGTVTATINGSVITTTTNVPASAKVATGFWGLQTLANTSASVGYGDWDLFVTP